MSTSFGNLLRRGREQAGLSQARLAELIGKSPSTIRAWEQGQTNPGDAHAVSAVAAVLGLDEGDMLGRAGFEQPVRSNRQSGLRELSNLASERTEMLALAPSSTAQRSISVAEPAAPTVRSLVDSVAPTTDVVARKAVTAVAPPMTAPTQTVVPLSYLEDDSEREFYRRRAVITAAVLVFFAIVAWWALGRAGGAIGDFFEDLIGQLNI